jgi:hypothetical protein
MWRSGRWTAWILFDSRVMEGHILSQHRSVRAQMCLLPCKDQNRTPDYNSMLQSSHPPCRSQPHLRHPNPLQESVSAAPRPDLFVIRTASKPPRTVSFSVLAAWTCGLVDIFDFYPMDSFPQFLFLFQAIAASYATYLSRGSSVFSFRGSQSCVTFLSIRGARRCFLFTKAMASVYYSGGQLPVVLEWANGLIKYWSIHGGFILTRALMLVKRTRIDTAI